MTCQSSVMAADMLAPESGEEGAVLLPAARPLVVLGRFVLLTASEYRPPSRPHRARPVRRTYPGLTIVHTSRYGREYGCEGAPHREHAGTALGTRLRGHQPQGDPRTVRRWPGVHVSPLQ